MNYVVITENDVSQWKDNTGREYYFPKRYLKYLTNGTVIVYYKGRMKDHESFASKRMTRDPHYFGIAEIGEVKQDNDSKKNDYYAEIINFKPFSYPVLAKQNGQFIEKIPSSRLKNYWRDGVRPVDGETFNSIIGLSDLNNSNATNDSEQEISESYTGSEGKLKLVYSTKYERDIKLREKAIEIHGLNCMGCGFNFEKAYGEWGAGFIHVHHTKPLSNGEGQRVVNPLTDMIVLCPNCHSMVHRRRNNTLSLDELLQLLMTKTIN